MTLIIRQQLPPTSGNFRQSQRGAREARRVVEFTVKDQGIGIPQPDQDRLFDTFHRANNVGDIPGTGLGMAITERAVDAVVWAEGQVMPLDHLIEYLALS